MSDADFNALQASVGPKRVKTKEVEIEAHDPMKLQSLQERRAAKPMTLGQFPRTYVVPKYPNPVCANDFRYDPNDHNLLD